MATTLKANFRVANKIESFYTGGKVHVASDGSCIFCSHGDEVKVLDAKTGKTTHSIKDEGADEVTCFAVTNDNEIIVVAYRNSLLKQWNWKDGTCTRTWQSLHRGPVVSMAFDSTSTLLATGSSDSTIKLWDIIRQYCTHNLRGSQGVVSLVQFHPDPDRLHLFSVSDDNHIRIWDLKTSSCLCVLETHYGAVTSLSFSHDGNTMLSSGRDSVVVIWDLVKNQPKKTLPVFETLESVILLPEDQDFPNITPKKEKNDLCFLTAGAKGIIKVWTSAGRCLYEQRGNPIVPLKKQTSDDQDQPAIITSAMICEAIGCVAVVTYDHNIILFRLEDLKLEKQFVGYNEEILDLKLLGKNESHLAVASNSEQIRVFELSSGSCQILTGHTDIVMSLDVFQKGHMMVSSSKDNTVRIWSMHEDTSIITCKAIGLGHTHSVGTIVASRLSSKFCVSGSEDCTLKVWRIPEQTPEEGNKEPAHMKVIFTEKAHDKDINSVCLSPNDKLLATGSQDRVAKLWHMEKEVLLGSFRGHRRGIWCVQFSPTDQALATSSADGSIKIWALSDFTCVKTFEGHDASVLKVIFLTRGMQLLSSGSDGLLKLWTIKTNECVTTLDEHNDKVWSVTAGQSEEKIITAGADSNILIWEDVTQIELEEKAEKEEDQIIKEQQLSNLMLSKKFTKALRLAITLDQPFKALGIIRTILEEPDGETQLSATITKLRPDQIESVLRFAQTWNMNSKHCHFAHCVLGIILRSQDPDDLAELPGIKDILEGFLPYSERHFQRLSRMLEQSMFVQYTWQVMRRASGVQEITDEVEATTSDGIGMKDFVLDKRGDITQENEDDDDEEEEEDSSDGHDDEEEETMLDVEEKPVRVNKNSKQVVANTKFIETPMTRDFSDDEEEESAASLRTTGSVKVSPDKDASDEEDEDEEEKENKSTRRRKSGKKEESRTNSLKKVQKRTFIKNQESHDSDEEEVPSPVKRKTRHSTKEKASATPGRSSKRKSALKLVEDSGKSLKKSTPSPYNKRLRNQSRK
ncbi:transducin beta-like protein 3 isoform X1 [Lytechinus variegatus]|uniref:transducin beta-like protein 3 isoform X1 n=2 Tax=Lytechinus variegatus TaxID=7654 RepID=UPI001BB2B18B|nr:transducin beta-like protein 3 isoform X1 [Lytechinus variegatus]